MSPLTSNLWSDHGGAHNRSSAPISFFCVPQFLAKKCIGTKDGLGHLTLNRTVFDKSIKYRKITLGPMMNSLSPWGFFRAETRGPSFAFTQRDLSTGEKKRPKTLIKRPNRALKHQPQVQVVLY